MTKMPNLKKLSAIKNGDAIIYFLFKGKEVVYIGQTTAFFQRMGSHSSDKDFDEINWYSVEHDDLNLLEAALIRAFAPKYNSANSKKKKKPEDGPILKKYGFDLGIPVSDLKSLPLATSYGSVVYFSPEGEMIFALYDNDEEAICSDEHDDDCEYNENIAFLKSLKLSDSAESEAIEAAISTCLCPSKAIIYPRGEKYWMYAEKDRIHQLPDNDQFSDLHYTIEDLATVFPGINVKLFKESLSGTEENSGQA